MNLKVTKYSFQDVIEIVSDKILVSDISLSNYVSTENMLPNNGGLLEATTLPAVKKVNHFKNKDTLFSNIRTYFRKIHFSKNDGGANPDVLIFRTKNEDVLLSEFLYYLISNQDFVEYTVHTSKGAKMPRGDKDAILRYEFSIPDKEYQKAVVSILRAIDDKIELLHCQNKTLREIAELVFKQWFIYGENEDWSDVKVKDFVKFNESSINRASVLDEILYLDTGSLTKGTISELQKLKLSDAPSRAKRLVKHNDILISTVRPNQCHYGIISKPMSNLVVSTGFCTITCEKISPYFIYLLLTNEDMTEYLHRIAENSTTAYPSLKPDDIGDVTFKLPYEDLLKKFHELAEGNWNKIHANHEQITTLEKLRDLILPKLMNGELRVKLD